MQNIKNITAVCNSMLEWARKSNWRSYDPYDAGLSPIGKLLPKKGRWALMHMCRLSPVNIRPLLYVNKQIHPKGIAHIMQACIILSNIEKRHYMLHLAKQLADMLIEIGVWDNDKCSWNYPFPYITRVLSVRDSSNIVNTSLIASALLTAYEKFNNSIYFDAALAASKFIIDNIGFHSYPNSRICFYYAPNATQTLTIHNSNLICASFLHRLGKIANNSELIQLANAAALYSIDCQRDDGLWHYSENPDWRSIDCFHNGFILDALMLISSPERSEPFFSSIKVGMRGFRKFLNEDGTISHILNRPYPKDIRSYSKIFWTILC